MRIPSFLIAALLATTGLSLLPGAHARADTCTSATSASCPGFFCRDANGDRSFQESECTSRDDVDPCMFQSDCCGGPIGGGFWCPDEW